MADDPAPGASADLSASQPGDDTAPAHGSQPGDDIQPGDGQPTTVDLTSVPIVLNGGSTVDVSTLTSGERIVVLGETSADTGNFTPRFASAFNRQDVRPATHRHHHEG